MPTITGELAVKQMNRRVRPPGVGDEGVPTDLPADCPVVGDPVSRSASVVEHDPVAVAPEHGPTHLAEARLIIADDRRSRSRRRRSLQFSAVAQRLLGLTAAHD
jgi:hypothetical protein